METKKVVFALSRNLLFPSFGRMEANKITERRKSSNRGGTPGLVVMGDDSCLSGRGFESRRRLLDGHFSH